MTKNRFALFIIILSGIFYLGRMTSLKASFLEDRILYLEAIIQYSSKGINSEFENVDLTKSHFPIVLCGQSEVGFTVLEIIPFRALKIWYGAKAKSRMKEEVPDERWVYRMEMGKLKSDNESLKHGVLFHDNEDLFLLGPGVNLSSEKC